MSTVEWVDVTSIDDVTLATNAFYDKILAILDQFYPLRTVTVSDRDPPFMTPDIKLLLRHKNNLMRRGHLEAANRISDTIRHKIIKQNIKTFSNSARGSKEMWESVRVITGKTKAASTSTDFNATQLNEHYAAISHDKAYVPPYKKPLNVKEDDLGHI